ncbi:MAG: O-antigen ligase family protein [Phycisphaerales bacterium]|nr:O-antigen ligase family protein [Phycisphaerales bacterium]
MALGHVAQTPNGVEVKTFVFHLAACVALILFAARAFLSGLLPPERSADRGAWFFAQVFLIAWVGVSFASAGWSGDASSSIGQATLYGLAIAYAIGVAWTIEPRHIERVLLAYVVIAALGGGLCAWYFYERNPFHRPGFPIGNPSTLGACVAPAILIVLMWVWQGLRAIAWRDTDLNATERRSRIRRMVLSLIAAPALLWCFKLAGSRGAAVGMLMGLWMLLYLPAGRRGRWVLMAFTITILASVTLWVSQSSFDFAMARGATIRFRLYAWQYAANMWGQRPISGMGAGAYPRYATAMSAYDNALDPAAFMGSNFVEHAHNELFEVLAEIGLVGGVTFVGGYVATLLGALALMRTPQARARRGLFIALIAALTSLIVDSLFGVGLRLPGPPAVMLTLLGLLWAACRSVSHGGSEESAKAQQVSTPSTARPAARIAIGFAALIATTGAGWAAISDWEGALLRREAAVARAAGNLDLATSDALAAEHLLLDPVRQLLAAHEALQAREDAGQLAFLRFGQAYNNGADRATLSALHAEAVERLTLTHQAANDLHHRAALFGRVAAIAARAAEMLSALQEPFNPKLAQDWSAAADQAWRMHRRRDPYDFETLMALTRYPATTVERIELLRDALRNDLIPDDNGERVPVTFHARWRAALLDLAKDPAFPDTLEGLRREALPINPQSDADTILGHLAPEIYRLQAAFLAIRGDFHDAAHATLPASALYYVPLVSSRFPTLFSVTKLEEAEYRYRSGLKNAIYAADASLQAISRLPDIQKQKADTQRRPFELRRVRYLVAARQEIHAQGLLRTLIEDHAARDVAFEGALFDKALVALETGDEAEARKTLARLSGDASVERRLADAYVQLATLYVRNPPIARPDVEPWLQAAIAVEPAHVGAWGWLAWLRAQAGDVDGVNQALGDAEAAGVTAADMEAIRSWLRAEFPGLLG